MAAARRWARIGTALLALHVLLLCLPPLPPDVDGSLWSYLLGYAAVAALLRDFRDRQAAWAGVWADADPPARRLFGFATAGGALLAALALRSAAPGTYQRFADESGLFEPLTLGCYVAAALRLHAAARHRDDTVRRQLQLLAGGFVFLALEEVDWLGLWGAFFGSPGGVYAGALHDVLALAVEGALPPLAAGLLAAALAGVALVLWRRGHLRRRPLAALLRAPDRAWAGIAVALLAVAALIDAHLLRALGRPSLEEALELPAALCLLAWAFERAERTPRELAPREPGGSGTG